MKALKNGIIKYIAERRNCMKLSNKELMRDLLWILAGNIALSAGVAWFVYPIMY